MAVSSKYISALINHLNVRDFGAVGNGIADDTAALQAVLNLGGHIVMPDGLYKTTAPLLFKSNTRFVGEARGAGARIIPTYSGAGYPLTIDEPSAGAWIYDLEIEKIHVDASFWTGTATHVVNIDNFFTGSVKHVTVDSCPAAKRCFRVGKTNDITLYEIKVFGNAGTPVVGIEITSVNGPVNGLRLIAPDVEVCDTGILFTGTTNRITCDVITSYFEECDIYIDWDSANVESRLAILGGNMIQRALSTGVKIRQSNCSVIGLATNSAGTYSVDIDGAATSRNCHVIGGNLRAAVRDTARLLSTNTTGNAAGSKTFDPGSLADGVQQLTDVTAPGAAVGSFAQASFTNDLLGIDLHAHVSAADTVRCVFQNETGGTLDLASGTLAVRVTR